MKILVVEDDDRVARFMVRALNDDRYTVDLCATGADAISQAQMGVYDAVVLDWMLPDVDGLSVCRSIRRAGVTVPIVMVTARGEVPERVAALDAGADDYVVKPFHIDELLARMRAVLRRGSTAMRLRAGDIEIDRLGRRAIVASKPLDLTAREYDLLQYLVQRTGETVTRTDLLTHVWHGGTDEGSNLIDVHVSNLRAKLGARAWMIATVRGAGYRLLTQRKP